MAETQPALAANDCSESETWTRWVLFNEGKTEPSVSRAQQSHGLESEKKKKSLTELTVVSVQEHLSVCFSGHQAGEILQILSDSSDLVIYTSIRLMAP